MERCAESGNARPGVAPAHAIGSRQLEGSLHVVLVPLALQHTSHHTSTAIAQHCKSARLTLVKHGLALVRSAHFHGLEPRDTVLEL